MNLSGLWQASKLGTSLLTGWQSLLLRVGLVCAILAIGAVWVYAKGRESGLREMYSFQAKVQAEGEKAIAARAAKMQRQKEITDATVKGLQGDLAAVRGDYDRVRQQSDARGRSLSELAHSSLAACPAQAADLSAKLARLESGNLAILQRADEEHARYIRLWDWAEQQAIVKH